MSRNPALAIDLPPLPCAGLEDACAEHGPALAPALLFLLARAAGLTAGKMIGLVTGTHWQAERGRLSAQALGRLGIRPEQLLIVMPDSDQHGLWALEEMLKSGEAGFAVGAIAEPSLTATRRLDHAARQTGASVALLRLGLQAPLSAARRRWRIAALPSLPHLWDRRAAGPPAWRAELLRRRDGPTGAWNLEWCDEAHRLTVARRLADYGLAAATAGEPQRAAA